MIGKRRRGGGAATKSLIIFKIIISISNGETTVKQIKADAVMFELADVVC